MAGLVSEITDRALDLANVGYPVTEVFVWAWVHANSAVGVAVISGFYIFVFKIIYLAYV